MAGSATPQDRLTSVEAMSGGGRMVTGSRPRVSALMEAAFWAGLIGLAILARGVSGGANLQTVRVGAGAEFKLLEILGPRADRLIRMIGAWYEQTPPLERVSWGGLVACGLLGVFTLVNRLWMVRRSRVVPASFRSRLQARLTERNADWMQVLDYCELNPSPASRIILAPLRRWGRPMSELERSVSLATENEVSALRRHTDTLRRVAVLAPLIGLLGSLAQAGRTLNAQEPGLPIGPAIAAALTPMICAVGLAILAVLAYDGIAGRIDTLATELDRIGLDTLEALGTVQANSGSEASARTHRPEPASPYQAPFGVRPGAVAEPRTPSTAYRPGS